MNSDAYNSTSSYNHTTVNRTEYKSYYCIHDLTYMWTAHRCTTTIITLLAIQKLWIRWLNEPEIPELQCAGSRLLHIQYVLVMLLYGGDNKSNAKQWNSSWPKWHSYQPLSTLAGLSKASLLDWRKCLGRINELIHIAQLDDGAFLWPGFLFWGRGRSNKRQASSRLVISWEAGTPLLPNWQELTANKGSLPAGETDCWRHTLQWPALHCPQKKTCRSCPGSTWPIKERNGELMSF